MSHPLSVDSLFVQVDQFVASLEEKGFDMLDITRVLTEYTELTEELADVRG